ncbi:hypothetical protein NL676_008329 [Syzygium grande]|nr:hypothetical protein NL676_008329 [Syzygium grande]
MHTMGRNSSRPWTELSGETNWKDMLDRLDEDLRTYLIHYGERVQAIGDAFNGRKESEGYGLPRYLMDELFHKVGLETASNPFRYEVTRYFHVPMHKTILQQPDRMIDSYSDAYFAELLGKSVNELWEDYQLEYGTPGPAPAQTFGY